MPSVHSAEERACREAAGHRPWWHESSPWTAPPPLSQRLAGASRSPRRVASLLRLRLPSGPSRQAGQVGRGPPLAPAVAPSPPGGGPLPGNRGPGGPQRAASRPRTRAAGSCRLALDQRRRGPHRPGRLDQQPSGRRPPPVPVDLRGAGGRESGGHLPGEGHGADGLNDQRFLGPAAGRRRATGPGAYRRRRRVGPPRRTGGHHRTGLRRMDTAGAERRLSGRDGTESRRAVRVPHRTERPGEHLNNESHQKPRRAFFANRSGITRISRVFSEHFPRNTGSAFWNTQHSSLFWSASSDDSAGRRGWAMDRTQESNTYHTGYSCK